MAAEVRAELARQRKTQGQLAGVLGMSPQAVSRRMCGAQAFDVNELQAVADFLGVAAVRLFELSTERASA